MNSQKTQYLHQVHRKSEAFRLVAGTFILMPSVRWDEMQALVHILAHVSIYLKENCFPPWLLPLAIHLDMPCCSSLTFTSSYFLVVCLLACFVKRRRLQITSVAELSLCSCPSSGSFAGGNNDLSPR